MSAPPHLHHSGQALDRATAHVRALVRQLATGLDRPTVLDRILTAVLDVTAADGYLLVARFGREELVTSHGLDEERVSDLVTSLTETGEIDDALLDTETHALVAPIDAGVAVVGWLATFHEGQQPPGEENADRLAHLGYVIGAALVIADAFERTERTSTLNAALLDLSKQLSQERDEVVIARRVAELMPTIVGADRTAVLLMDPHAEALVAVAAVGFEGMVDQAMDFTIAATTPAVQRVIADGKPRWIDHSNDDPFIIETMHDFDYEFASVAPIVADDELLGLVLALHPDDSATRSEEPMQVLASVADQAAIAISRRRLLDDALHAATHDHLTGLVDRKLFEELIERCLKDRRGEGRVAVCFIDLDDFAEVNDSYGHEAGDALLIEVGRRLARSVREDDTVARISGDEFGIMLPQVTDVEVATRIMYQVASQVTQPWRWDEHELEVGVSIGVAFAPQDGEDARSLIRAADAAMYRAKHAGEVLRFA